MTKGTPIPTQEELEIQAEKDQAELDELAADDQAKKDKDAEDALKASKDVTKANESDKDDDKDDADDTGDDQGDKDDKDGDDQDDDKKPKPKEKEADKDDEKDPEPKKPPKKGDVDYKKKFSDSSAGAQVLHSRVKAFEKASEVPEPTEKDMQAEYADWEDLSDFEKKQARFTWVQTKRNEAQDKIVAESKDIDKWNKKVDEFIEDPQNLIDEPELEGKLDDFKLYAQKDSSAGVAFEVLVSAFLRDADKVKPSKKKGGMFPEGTGGENKKSKGKKKLTIEQGAKLKDNNYNEYKRQLQAGNIEEF